ncbi:hypothetical protein DPMN_110132 [Dreissena polymorpha]|uniref:Uncharacterized protein n=1 Tax=Dreissena polymorpha TaxID=45954 RepID=A0A9D4KCE5_DREPO|nr:hypothetical protein DPMN_110132 [Dreissena polymorpha]
MVVTFCPTPQLRPLWEQLNKRSSQVSVVIKVQQRSKRSLQQSLKNCSTGRYNTSKGRWKSRNGRNNYLI